MAPEFITTQCWILMANFPRDCAWVPSRLQQGALLLSTSLVNSSKNKYISKKDKLRDMF